MATAKETIHGGQRGQSFSLSPAPTPFEETGSLSWAQIDIIYTDWGRVQIHSIFGRKNHRAICGATLHVTGLNAHAATMDQDS